MALGAMEVTICKLSSEVMVDKWDMIHTVLLMACLVVAVLVDSTLPALTTAFMGMVTTAHGEALMYEGEANLMMITTSGITFTLMSE